MRILVITPHYWPEPFRVTDLVAGLKARGHELEVLTGLPNYPAGRFFPGYGYGGPFVEEHEGVRVTRVPLVPRGAGGALRLVANYGSFALTASLRGAFRGRLRWDAVFVFGISPVTTLLPAALVRAIYGTPVVTWVQDLWPESVASAGFARSRALYRGAAALSAWLYRHCDRILIASQAYQPRLVERGVAPGRIEYLPQWAEDSFTASDPAAELPGGAWGEGFPVMFAGNLGRVQGLDTILDAAALLRGDSDVRWVFLGDGTMRDWLRAEVRGRGLDDRVFLLGRRPVTEMPAFYAKAGAMLVSLKPDATMALTVPAKLQSYLAAGRPVIGSIDGEGARVIEESGSGWAAPAGDAPALARVVARMKALGAEERAAMGRRGREFSEGHFARERCLDQLEAALGETARRERGG